MREGLCRIKLRLHWTRSNAKQPKFHVNDNLRKVSTGQKNFASGCLTSHKIVEE